MPCIDRKLAALASMAALTVGCSSPRPPPPAPAPAPAPTVAAPQPAPTPAPVPAPAAAPQATRPALPAMATARSWDEFRTLAARRMVQANPGSIYLGRPPEPLLAIPVLEIELNRDGSVRRVEVLRRPTQALDTVQLAIDAVHRAAPFSDVSRLPRPWKFSEVFLFDDNRRFKPRTLDVQ